MNQQAVATPPPDTGLSSKQTREVQKRLERERGDLEVKKRKALASIEEAKTRIRQNAEHLTRYREKLENDIAEARDVVQGPNEPWEKYVARLKAEFEAAERNKATTKRVHAAKPTAEAARAVEVARAHCAFRFYRMAEVVVEEAKAAQRAKPGAFLQRRTQEAKDALEEARQKEAAAMKRAKDASTLAFSQAQKEVAALDAALNAEIARLREEGVALEKRQNAVSEQIKKIKTQVEELIRFEVEEARRKAEEEARKTPHGGESAPELLPAKQDGWVAKLIPEADQDFGPAIGAYRIQRGVEHAPANNPAYRRIVERLGGEASPLKKVLDESLLGVGSQAAVFLGTSPIRDKVAIKVVVIDRKKKNGAKVWSDMRQEAKNLASIKHENVLSVYSLEELTLPADDAAYSPWTLAVMVLEYLPGGTLIDVEKKYGEAGSTPTADVLAACAAAARGTSAVHAKGLLHRDIKPENILYDGESTYVLADFGIAAAESAESGLTGTVGYVAPEVAIGYHEDVKREARERKEAGESAGAVEKASAPFNALSDVFAVGSTAYRLLSGKTVLEAVEEERKIAWKPEDGPLKRLLNAYPAATLPDVRKFRKDLPKEVAETVMKCAALDPAQRFQSAQEAAEAFQEAWEKVSGSGVRRSRWAFWK